jgi:ABC transporter, ATP-binding protein
MKNYLKNIFAITDQGANDLIGASTTSFFVYVVNMLPAILLMMIMNKFIFGVSASNTFYFIASVIVIIAIYVLLNLDYNALYNATYKESENLRIEISTIMARLPLSYFSKHDLSDLAQTIMEDVNAIEHALSHAIGKTIGFAGFFIIVSIMLILGNPVLGLATILPILAAYILLWVTKKIQIKNQKIYYDKLRKNSESFQETIELQQEIKSFGLSKKVKDKLYKDMEVSEQIHIKSELTVGFLMNLIGVLLYLELVLVLITGAILFTKGLSLLYFIGYLLAAIKLKEGSEGIMFSLAELFYLDSMIQRIKELRETKLQEGEDVGLKDFNIEFENVEFGYDKDTKVLRGVSFTANQNEVTALVGSSGCGKTSILRLISRLYDYDLGSIKISDMDIKNISTKSLFSKISIVFQEVTLFNSSVLENIRIGNLNATDEEVKNAARLANCEEFVEKLPNGYDTIIGENGATLSGGERQRISIARAFLKNSPIIILDEIAASLDVENEKKIQESLNKLTMNKTVVIISHRLKSIENVDKIVVLNDGKVEAFGKHKELLSISKTYKNLVESAELVEEYRY